MSLKLCSLAAAVALAFAGAAQAQQQPPRDAAVKSDRPVAERKAEAAPRKASDAEEERIEAAYKAAKEKCEALKGNPKDVCEKQAKAEERIAKAELEAKRNPTQRNQRKLAETRADAEYDVARERCDDLQGDRKSACQKEARAKRDQAKAQIKQQYAARKDDDRRAATGATK